MYCIHATWVLFLTAKFGWGVRETGLSLALFGVIALVYQLGLARVLIPRFGERRIMLLSMGVGAVECAGYALATHGWMIYAVMIVGGIGVLGGQVTQGVLSHQVGDDEQGALQGAVSSLSSLCGIAGPVIGTGLFSYFTRDAAPVQLPGVTFYLAAALNTLALLIAARAMKHARFAGESEPAAAEPGPR
jgi:DHA1 family tetracycline resistance protein-like MFS transporter